MIESHTVYIRKLKREKVSDIRAMGYFLPWMSWQQPALTINDSIYMHETEGQYFWVCSLISETCQEARREKILQIFDSKEYQIGIFLLIMF